MDLQYRCMSDDGSSRWAAERVLASPSHWLACRHITQHCSLLTRQRPVSDNIMLSVDDRKDAPRILLGGGSGYLRFIDHTYARISTYRVGQKSKLLILSEYVNKTEKIGGT